MGCGCGMTCWRRLRDRHAAGVWDALHLTLLDRLGAAGQIDWSRAALDAQAVPAPGTATRKSVPRKGLVSPSAQSAQTRPTGAVPAPSDTRSPTDEALRLRSCSPERTPTTRKSSTTSSTPYRRSGRRAAADASARQSSTPTRATTTRAAGRRSPSAGSKCASRRGVEREAGAAPLGGGAVVLMAESAAASPSTVRASPRHPRRADSARLRAADLGRRYAVLDRLTEPGLRGESERVGRRVRTPKQP